MGVSTEIRRMAAKVLELACIKITMPTQAYQYGRIPAKRRKCTLPVCGGAVSATHC
jgi:hypothetical protein